MSLFVSDSGPALHCSVICSPASQNELQEAAYCFSKAIFTSPPINVPIHVCTQRNVHIYNQVLFNLSMGFEVKLGTPPTPRPTEDPSITTTTSKHIFQSWLLILKSRSYSMHLRQVLTKTKIPYISKQ